jgi:hypothetical protein
VFFFSVAYEFRVPVFFEPVSVVKGPRIAPIIEYVSVMDWTAFFIAMHYLKSCPL